MIKQSATDKRFTAINYVCLTVFFLLIFYPILIIVSSSFSDPAAVSAGKVFFLPIDFSLKGYKAVFEYSRIASGFANSAFLLIVGTVLCLFVTLMGAYPLSRKDMAGKKWIMLIFTFTMFFGGGMIPFFMLIRDLGLIDSHWALILPGSISVWNIIMMRTYFQSTVPDELLEAAKIDGCNDFKFLFRIVIPLSMPIIAVLGLFTAVGYWNSYFNAMIFINTPEKFPLQLILRDILITNQADATQIAIGITDIKAQLDLVEALKYAVIVVSSLPLMMLFPLVHKFFVKGLVVGSLKG